uniref:Uncharacterized protein n=1 Tax=Arundo donax TaxID=35708 RepID=A0A0A8YJE1_ARUDO
MLVLCVICRKHTSPISCVLVEYPLLTLDEHESTSALTLDIF